MAGKRLRSTREFLLVFALVAAGTIPAAMAVTGAAYACHWPIDWIIDEQDFSLAAFTDSGVVHYGEYTAYTWGLLLFCQETHSFIVDGIFSVSGIPFVFGALTTTYMNGLTIKQVSPSPDGGGIGQDFADWEQTGGDYQEVHFTRAGIPRGQWGTSLTVRVEILAIGLNSFDGDSIEITLSG